MECDIAPHINEDYSGHEHLIVLKQPREDTFKMKFARTQRCPQNEVVRVCST